MEMESNEIRLSKGAKMEMEMEMEMEVEREDRDGDEDGDGDGDGGLSASRGVVPFWRLVLAGAAAWVGCG